MNPEYPANGYPGKELPLQYDPVPLPDKDRVRGTDGDESGLYGSGYLVQIYLLSRAQFISPLIRTASK